MLLNLPQPYFAALKTAMVAIVLFVIAFDMGGQFGLRNSALVMLLPLLFMLNRFEKPSDWLYAFGFLICYPALLLWRGYMEGGDIIVGVSQLSATLGAFLLYISLNQCDYIKLTKILFWSIASVAMFSLILYFGAAAKLPMVENTIQWLSNSQGGFFGDRSLHGELFTNIYFKSTLFFIPAEAYFLFIGSPIIAGILFGALVVAFSKTGIVFSIFIFLVYLFTAKATLRSKLYSLAIYFAIGVICYDFIVQLMISDFFSGSSATVNIREGQAQSVFVLFRNSWINLLFGFGLGTEFYSLGSHTVVSNIELDHLNTIRKYGLIWSLLFFAFVIFSAVRVIRLDNGYSKLLGYCLLLAFIVAGTNPVLLSPVFFMLLIITHLAYKQRNKTFENQVDVRS